MKKLKGFLNVYEGGMYGLTVIGAWNTRRRANENIRGNARLDNHIICTIDLSKIPPKAIIKKKGRGK